MDGVSAEEGRFAAAIAGNEARRFGEQRVRGGACGIGEAGNEAEGETSGEEGRRVTQVTERRIKFGGGAGGVDIHVGG